MDLTLFTSLSAFAVAIVGANYKFTRDIRSNLKADISAFEKRMEESDKRWLTLLTDMHRVDKDVHLIKEKIK